MNALADHVFEFIGTYVTPRKYRFFADGWGDVELASRVASRARQSFTGTGSSPRVDDVALTWTSRDVLDDSFDIACDVTRDQGEFTSPFADVLPVESARVAFTRWSPSRRDVGTTRRVAILLPCTGDQTEWYRHGIARELLADGIECVVPTIAYYGTRKPEAQWAHVLRTVADAKIQLSVTPVEMMVLARLVHDDITKNTDGVSAGKIDWVFAGISLGGTMSALAASALASSRADVGGDVGVCCIAGPSDGKPFVDGSIGKRVAWDVLARECGDDDAKARDRMLDELRELDVELLVAAKSVKKSVVLTAKHDRFVGTSSNEGIDRALRVMAGAGDADADAYEHHEFDGGHLNFLWKRKAVVAPAIKRAFGIEVMVL